MNNDATDIPSNEEADDGLPRPGEAWAGPSLAHMVKDEGGKNLLPDTAEIEWQGPSRVHYAGHEDVFVNDETLLTDLLHLTPGQLVTLQRRGGKVNIPKFREQFGGRCGTDVIPEAPVQDADRYRQSVELTCAAAAMREVNARLEQSATAESHAYEPVLRSVHAISVAVRTATASAADLEFASRGGVGYGVPRVWADEEEYDFAQQQTNE